MKKFLTIAASAAFALNIMSAQTPTNLWPDGPASDNGHDNTAEITFYAPVNANNLSHAVVICPGGGYSMIAIDHEGHDIARWLADNGVAAAVVKYRLPHGNREIPLADAREAMRQMRAKCAQWGAPAGVRTGIMGSSAGGHLASSVCTHRIDDESHPDFAVLFYPVISTDPAIRHEGSITKFLGKDIDNPDALKSYSNDLSIDSLTPPTLLLLSDDDTGVKPENSIRYYRALQQNGIAASMHIFPIGAHGWGFRPSFPYHDTVKALILDWIARQ